jgi:hypothetical protein
MIRHLTVVDRPQELWPLYSCVIREARARGISFAVGGGHAVAAYTQYRKPTKDIDLYILPADRDAMIDVLTSCGLEDYYAVLPYDRKWIYRSYRNDVIIDIMWAMPNQRTEVDLDWLVRGPEVDVNGARVRVLPAEELIWAKLYVLQRDRSDWPDILNLIYATGPALDWDHLLARVGEDAPLLFAVLSVFRWLSPERAQELPSWLWPRLCEDQGAARSPDLLDTRPWFLPTLASREMAS